MEKVAEGSTDVNMRAMRTAAARRTCPPAGCPPVTRAALGARDARDLATCLKVLADPTRLRLLSLVAAHRGGEACVCTLVAPVGLSQPTVTHHLQRLHRAGFLDRAKRGIWVWYRIRPQALAAVTAALR
jgi:ArsR family transcriptional regulator